MSFDFVGLKSNVDFVLVDGNLALQAYDQHLNMILGDVEEIVTTVEIDDETYEEIVRVYFAFAFFLILFISSYD